jgi:glycerophosphoryl diester phosphodiesterase
VSAVEPDTRPLRRVGHKGADRIVPGNTLQSFDAALAAGVDMIEFDVLPERGTDRLLLAHDYEDAATRDVVTLEEGLAYLLEEPFDGIEFDVDMKLPGYERGVLDALRAFGALERSLISTQYVSSLELVRAAEPAVRLGWTVPRVRRDPFRSPLLAPSAHALAAIARSALPTRAAAALRAGRCDALMAHWRLVSRRLVRAVAGAGGELYVWTVDDLETLRALAALGVTGVITNDPRLFGQLHRDGSRPVT